ncbi:MAG: NAD-dependent protein deacetylase [Candidatus Baldrarchaeia archaeon]
MSEAELRARIREAAELIVESKKNVALTGAGISVESGIPDFRGPNGLWKRYGEHVGHISFFFTNPGEFWKFALEVAKVIFAARPNPAHYALAELEKMGKLHCIITQNIDGLHQKAGSKNVIEIHGTAWRLVCLQCGTKFPVEEIASKLMSKGFTIPRCLKCEGILKPDTVFFGERLPEEELKIAISESMSCDLFMVVGSSLVVYPAASLPGIAKSHGAKTILVNLERTAMDEMFDVVIYGKAGEILPKIVEEVKKMM